MKRYSLSLSLTIFLFAALPMHAQFVKSKKKEVIINWQNMSFEKDGVYGAEIDKAREFLKEKKAKKNVIVAIIGPGVDFEQQELKGKFWKNPKEKPNGKDDDKNSLIDDIHGWNFLGAKDGKTIEKISRESDREFFRLKNKAYPEILSINEKYIKLDKIKNKRMEIIPDNLEEYNYYQKKILPESSLARAYGGQYAAEIYRSYLPQFDSELKAMFPDTEITETEVNTYISTKTKELEKDTLQAISLFMINLGFRSAGSKKWNDLKEFINHKHPAYIEATYLKELDKTVKDDRQDIGDNPYDINDISYGNNNLMAQNAGYGTLYAGLIAADRNTGNIHGIADNVTLMHLRIEADYYGETYMKDMALAIRYAVNNGADIIQMGKTNTLFPVHQSDWVEDALAYAESKDVLIIMPMMDLAYNIDEIPFYPNKKIKSNHNLKNMITVAASNAEGKPFLDANYSNTQLDIFAPGENVTSTYTGNTIRSFSSSGMAASVVSGIAALLKSYYPDLTAEEICKILIENVTSREGEEVEKNTMLITNKSPKKVKDLFIFEDLCLSGGIVNAYKSILAANKISKQMK